jgi:hypothetical protein
MEYTRILKEMRDEEKLDDIDDLEEFKPLELPEDGDESEDELPKGEDIELGTLVKVVDVDSLDADSLDLSEDDFEDFKSKVEDGDIAIVFDIDIDDDDATVADIVFRDGFEVFKIPTVNLEVTDDED